MFRGFEDRVDAGRQLADLLGAFRGRDDVVVVALPRGGVPIGAEVAHALRAPLDILLARKLGAPGQPELAVGAVARGGVRVFNPDVVQHLGLTPSDVDQLADSEEVDVGRREEAYREGRPPLSVEGSTVLLVDDGIATGATMRAAIRSLRQRGARRVVVAAPVAAPAVAAALRDVADEVVCVHETDSLTAVSLWYERFPQLDDEEVRRLLRSAGTHHKPHLPEQTP